MSALELAIKAAVYASPVSVPATYTDLSGDQIEIRVLKDIDAEQFLGGAEVGIRGNRIVFYALKSEVAKFPRKGESIEVDSVSYLIDDVNERGLYEWLIYACT